ncbi:hypothetical protein DB347_06925 [Opitutaceae bacterium EW11]|nr:hypothetical protein DB347_06925 [Opitutaceae bacterium EW11]
MSFNHKSKRRKWRGPALAGVSLLCSALAAWWWLGRRPVVASEPRASRVAVNVIEVTRVRSETVRSYVATTAPLREVVAAAETQGKVVSIDLTPGQSLQRGQVLAKLDDTVLRANLEKAVVAEAQAKSDLERTRTLFDAGNLSREAIESADFAYRRAVADLAITQQQLEYATIRAPFDGVVDARIAELGGMLQPGSGVAHMVDLQVIKVVAAVPESDIRLFSLGQPLEVSFGFPPSIQKMGKVSGIAAMADDAHCYRIEVDVPNTSEPALKAGLSAQIHLRISTTSAPLSVPRSAVRGAAATPQLWTVQDNHVRIVDLPPLSEATAPYIPVENVPEGTLVILDGPDDLQAGAFVEPLPSPRRQ